ncbi:hypothetical protein THASP1DRAFT_25604 [Thamnocephalis sphaerospora]|uniref:Uncharacterized protein n=1 Tax=Thamnocephalis sphaerospora TaxID=78915 RepID=A0A4P9XJR4_9FUNG|nr:hypothetical protein THASP1DRAFT_25604 [Thamnocephalis sphaerospora]|eukprot:RKP05995.1 hypothetical protein THASP1DRAFT_25604 [Thamnocephalis sphaerospora]
MSTVKALFPFRRRKDDALSTDTYGLREPRRLVILRVGTIAILSAALLAAVIVQTLKFAKPVILYNSQFESEFMVIPAFLFLAIVPVLHTTNAELLGDLEWHSGSPASSGSGTGSRIKQVNWNKEILDPESAVRLREYNGSPAYVVEQNEHWRFAPVGLTEHGSQNPDDYYFSRMRVNLYWPSSKVNMTEKNTQFTVDVHTLEDPFLLQQAAKNEKPVDIRQLNGPNKVYCTWGSQCTITVTKYYEVDTEDQKYTRYTTQAVSLPGPGPGEMYITIQSGNLLANGGTDGYNVETRTARYSFTLLDLLSSLGGAISLLLAVYALLFGQRRVRPWGIVQKNVLRRSVLSSYPPDVVKIDIERRPASRTLSESQDGTEGSLRNVACPAPLKSATLAASETVCSEQSQEKSSGTALALHDGPLVEQLQELRQQHQQLVQHMHSLEAAVGQSIDGLEAFRLRTEAFYFAMDLFPTGDGASQTRNSMVQRAVSHYNTK